MRTEFRPKPLQVWPIVFRIKGHERERPIRGVIRRAMGEAKRRKQLDPNFGNPLYSRHGKAAHSHHLAPAPTLHQSTDVDAYEQYARQTVLTEQAALLQQAQGARNRLSYSQKEEALCLVVMQTFDSTNQIRMKFAGIEETKRVWRQTPGYLTTTPIPVEETFEEALSKRSDDVFLWTHLDFFGEGLVARLVPIENVEIARICHLRVHQ